MDMDFDFAGVLRAVFFLLIAAHASGFIFEKLRLPRVAGEIFAGILIGPSILGALAPDVAQLIVDGSPETDATLSVIYWIGLILLMFSAGFRVQPGLLEKDRRVVLTLLAGATILPFAAGWFAATTIDLTEYVGPAGSAWSITLIFAIAVAVTSIPVISKIFLDLGLMETRFARIVITTSMFQDIILWSVLSAVLASAAATAANALTFAILTAFGFCVAGLILGPRLLRLAVSSGARPLVRSQPLGFALVWCLFGCWVAEMSNVNVVFGALIAGVSFGYFQSEELSKHKEQILRFSMGSFVPVYFALVGFRIDIPGAFDPYLFLGFLLFSSAVEAISVFLTARFLKFRNLTALNFAVAMNTRGGPGIVLASITYEYGLIDERLFVTLVLSAIVTSVFSGVWFERLKRKDLPLID